MVAQYSNAQQDQAESMKLSVVVVGASGDLAKKMTFPSLFQLFKQKLLPPDTLIFGYARSEMTDEDLHNKIREYLDGNQEDVDSFLQLCSYHQGQYDQSEPWQELDGVLREREGSKEAPKDSKVRKLLDKVKHRHSKGGHHANHDGSGTVGRLFYLAVPPSTYSAVARKVKETCTEAVEGSQGWVRVVIEKPFGHDLASCKELGQELHGLFQEEQIFRIDHFLGKEMAQNMLTERFANRFLEPMYCHQHVASISITLREDFGAEGRGGFFDSNGIIRDVIQNHLVQLLAISTMECPKSFSAKDLRDAKADLLRSIQPVKRDEILVAQYTPAKNKPGYLQEEGVEEGSNQPTFAACVLHIDNDRWRGVPCILLAGKALNEHRSDIRIQLKPSTVPLFGDLEGYRDEVVFQMQPENAIYLRLAVKQPGFNSSDLRMADLDLTYANRFGGEHIPGPYERLVWDCIRGDQSQFVREDELEAQWSIFDDVLKAVDEGEIKCLEYEYGSKGPMEAEAFIQNAGYVPSKDYQWQQ